MKKIAMMMFVAAAAVSSASAEGLKVDFDGRGGAAAVTAAGIQACSVNSGNCGVQAVPAPAAPKAEALPGRPSPDFTDFQMQVMNGAINDVIRRNANNPELVRNFKWLRNASPAEKAAFVFAKPGQVYKFPKACYERNTRGLWDDVVNWVCEQVTTVECVFTCTYGESDVNTATNCYNDCHDVIVESCHQE